MKVLSGFINGVFLLFIGSFVLLEALQRLITPPDIKSGACVEIWLVSCSLLGLTPSRFAEKLLIVSVLGLCVNLVGVWAFHDLHGGHEGKQHVVGEENDC